MSPFITAYGRYYIFQILHKRIDDVCFIHTDGFIIKDNGKLKEEFRFDEDKLGYIKEEPIFKEHKTTKQFEIINFINKKRLA